MSACLLKRRPTYQTWSTDEPGGWRSGLVPVRWAPCRSGEVMRPRPGPAARAVRSSGGEHRQSSEGLAVGSVIKKRRKRMAKKKHRKLLKKTRVQRRNKK